MPGGAGAISRLYVRMDVVKRGAVLQLEFLSGIMTGDRSTICRRVFFRTQNGALLVVSISPSDPTNTPDPHSTIDLNYFGSLCSLLLLN
jgi:hypothetical protein